MGAQLNNRPLASLHVISYIGTCCGILISETYIHIATYDQMIYSNPQLHFIQYKGLIASMITYETHNHIL